MATKDIIGLALLLFAIPASVVICCASQRARDAAFFLITALAPLAFRLDMNFFSIFWYRGSTRGFEFSVMDVLAIGVLAGSVLFPRPGEKRWFWPASFGLMLLFFAYACGNVAFADPKIYGLFELSKMLRGLVFFLAAAMYVRSERELSILVVALGCAVCLEGALAVKERILGSYYRVTGTLNDANSLSMYVCTVAPVFVAAAASTLPKFIRGFSLLAMVSATVCVVLTLSRAGLPIFALIMVGTTLGCVSWRLTPKKIVVATLALLVAGGFLAEQSYLIQARWSHDSLKKEYEDPTEFESRGYFLRLAKVIVDDQFWGVGLNNWSYWVSKKYGAQLGTPYVNYDDLNFVPDKNTLSSFNFAAPAHCLAALTIGELGAPGLAIFLLLWLRWFQMGAKFFWPRASGGAHQLGVGIFFCTAGIFLQSITEWVYRQEQIFISFHVLLGTLAALCWLKKQKLKQLEPELCKPLEEEQFHHEPAVA